MGVYCDDGRGGAFCTYMKLFHVALEQFCPAEVSWQILGQQVVNIPFHKCQCGNINREHGVGVCQRAAKCRMN